MSDLVPPSVPLSLALADFAGQLGDHFPATFELQPGSVLLAADADDHPLPADAVAVRWVLEGLDEATLVVVLPDDAAALLREGPPEQDLVGALTPGVDAVVGALAPLFDGQVPVLGTGVEVPAGEALVVGPGDGVSIMLEDAGVHRVTVGLRMVVSDELLTSSTPGEEYGEYGEDYDDQDLPSAQAPLSADAGSPEPRVAIPGPGQVGVDGGGPPPAPTAPFQGVPSHQLPPAAVPGTPGQPGVRSSVSAPTTEAHPADFASFDQLTTLPGVGHSMAMLADVEMGVTAELGRTRLTVRDVLGLNPGSIIELDRAAGSPVDVVVNGTLIARGEVVVIDEEFGIRITEIIGMAQTAQPFPLQVAQ